MKYPNIPLIFAIFLLYTSTFLSCYQSVENPLTPPLSQYEWLLDPIEKRFPPADQALTQPGFRVSGVHYWQENWNFNFWSNLKIHRIDSDFLEISNQGFNTILLNIPWGYFQPVAFPPNYYEHAFEKLSVLMEVAARNRLYVILRIGTHEELPKGIQGRPFLAPYLLFDNKELESYYDLFTEISSRVSDWSHLLFIFFSWEDLSGHIFESKQSHESRLHYMKGAFAFRDHLHHKDLSYWNKRWETNYGSLQEIPFPKYGSLAYRDFLEFADQRLIDTILPAVSSAAQKGDPNIHLSYEVRVDSEPIWATKSDLDPDWFNHRRTWNLTSDYPIVSAYFSPSWGALNKGDLISAEKAEERLRYLLEQMESSITDKPIFFDQLNFSDSPPGLPLSTRFKGEEEIARFLELSLDTLHQHSLGYAIWSLRAYESNSLYNSSFEDGLRGWNFENPLSLNIRKDHDRREKFLSLAPGGFIRQNSRLQPNSAAPLKLRLMTRSRDGGKLLIRFEGANDQSSWKNLATKTLSPTDRWETYQVELSVAEKYRLILESNGSSPVEIDELSLFNWTQSPSILGQHGEPLGRRSEILSQTNRSWQLEAGKIRVTAPWSWRIETLAGAGYTNNDGWLSKQVSIPIFVPWFDAALQLQFYLPENDIFWSQGNSVQINLGSRSLGEHYLNPGMNRLHIPLGEPVYPRQWTLRMDFKRSFQPQTKDPLSNDKRTLAAVLVTVKAVGKGPKKRHWSGKILQTGDKDSVQVLVRVLRKRGSPLQSTLVIGHAGGTVGAKKTNSLGQALLELPLDHQKIGSIPLFIEVPDVDARISSVGID